MLLNFEPSFMLGVPLVEVRPRIFEGVDDVKFLGRTDRQTNKWTEERKDRQKEKRSNGRTEVQLHCQMNGQTNGRIDGRTNKWTRTDGQIEEHTNRQI